MSDVITSGFESSASTDHTLLVPVIDWSADFLATERVPGKAVYTAFQNELDQPMTVRFQVAERANIYAGTSISEDAYLPTKKGLDIVAEVKQTWKVTNSADPSFVEYFPVRAALTLNVPVSGKFGISDTEDLVSLLISAVVRESNGSLADGINFIRHGIFDK